MNLVLKQFIETIWDEYGDPTSPLYGKYVHTNNVCNITKNMDGQMKDIECYTRAHDIGRIKQYNLLQRYDDSIVTHNSLGIDTIENFIVKNDIPLDDEIYRLRLVIGYHGRLNLLNEIKHSDLDLKYLHVVTTADNLENGCCGALGYLEKELINDSKGYIKNQPKKNQKSCKTELLYFMEKGIWFDKYKYCETYAEYFVFACTLAIKSINSYPEIAMSVMNNPCYGFSSAIDGYIYLFDRYLDSPEKERAIRIINNYKL